MILNNDEQRGKNAFRKISLCCIFLQRLQHSKHGAEHAFSDMPRVPRKSNFRVASLCFMFLRRLHAFESHFRCAGSRINKPTFRVASLCFVFLNRLHAFDPSVKQHEQSSPKMGSGHASRKNKRNSTKQKCTCCKLNTESENGEEQTRTILTNTFRDIVPKLSRILVNQDAWSSSSIWTNKCKPSPKIWPNSLPWKDPNNKPKDTFETLEKRMHKLMELCKDKDIPKDILMEINAYQDYKHEVQCSRNGDISKLQVIRQKRKVTHKLTQALKDYSEVMHWHGAPEYSDDLHREARHLREVMQENGKHNNNLSTQFEDIFYAITSVEGSDSAPNDFMQQFAGDRSGGPFALHANYNNNNKDVPKDNTLEATASLLQSMENELHHHHQNALDTYHQQMMNNKLIASAGAYQGHMYVKRFQSRRNVSPNRSHGHYHGNHHDKMPSMHNDACRKGLPDPSGFFQMSSGLDKYHMASYSLACKKPPCKRNVSPGREHEGMREDHTKKKPRWNLSEANMELLWQGVGYH